MRRRAALPRTRSRGGEWIRYIVGMTSIGRRILSTRASLCAAAVGVAEAMRILLLSRLADGPLACHIPDDAFYYLQSARNFARSGRWTFDGVEPSSGFHLVWGYLLAGFYRMDPNASFHTVFFLGSLVQSACLVLAAFLITRSAERFVGSRAWCGVLLVFLSAASLLQGTWLMESGLTIASAAALMYLLTDGRQVQGPVVLSAAFLLGLLATLCRSDAGLLPISFLLANLYGWSRQKASASLVFMSAAASIGAASGVILTGLHTHWISGQWVQASAEQKLFWSALAGWSMSPSLHIFYSFFNPLTNAYTPFTSSHWESGPLRWLGPLVRVSIISLLAVGVGIQLRRRPTLAGPAAAALLTVLSYTVFYGYNSAAVQGWYVENYEAPAALLSGFGCAWFLERRRRISVMVLIAMSGAGIVCSLRPSSPWQEAMWRAGMYLKAHPERHPVGAWNTGIVGYFANNGVTNLDGLMNDAILPYAKRGDLDDYFLKRHMVFIFESPQIWKPGMAARGGYADGVLQGCISKTEDPFPDDPYNFYYGDHIRLYTVSMACLSARHRSF